MLPPITSPLPVPDRDAEHLRLLALFHFIHGGLDLLVVGAASFQFAFMRAIFSQMKYSQGHKNDPPPEFIIHLFLGIIVVFGLLYLASLVLNVMAGFFLEKRRHRTFSMVVAGLNCLQVPIGTVLGVFTIIVLNRDSVRAKFAAAEQASASA